MPKEVIYGDRDAPSYGTPERPEAWSVVEVRWNREVGYLQMATKSVDAVTGEDYWPKLEAIEVEPNGEPVELVAAEWQLCGFYTTMDRRGINELIRVLRRARDQAFGRDE